MTSSAVADIRRQLVGCRLILFVGRITIYEEGVVSIEHNLYKARSTQ